MDYIVNYILPLIYISPCYAANAAPLFLASIAEGRKPLDLGKKFIDGKRIFGDGKTIEGTIFGFFVGYIYFLSIFSFQSFLNMPILFENYFEGFLLVIGAIFGDIFGSFIKRRLNMKRGDMLPILDQTGFLIFAILFRSIFFGAIPYDIVIYLFVITFLVHIMTNTGAFKMGIKDEPF